MSETQIAVRYAKSVLELATERGQVDEVREDMLLFARTCDNTHALRVMLSNPIINTYKKKVVLNQVFSGKITALTTAFFDIIVRKTREGLLYSIAKEVEKQYNTERNRETAEVITATELTDELRRELNSLAAKMSGGKTITLNEKVNPDLIGGFVLQVQDKQLDTSIQSRLRNLKTQMTK
jgi:F-type H+-transporting ATPase subunit delta